MEKSIMYNSFVETQYIYDRNHFTLWCYNLFELNERLNTEMTVSRRLYVNDNGYLLRSYFVVLWEIIYNGKKYLAKQNDVDEKHLATIATLINELLEKCSDDDYFMINYFRNCASHIFLTRYSVLDENDEPKEEDKKTPFYTKEGNKYFITYEEILEKAENVFGSKLGISEESKYKENLIRRLYPIIHKYCKKIQSIDNQCEKLFYENMLKP